MRVCGKCKQPATHNKKTCGKPSIKKEPSFRRQCSRCQGWAHNVRTCQNQLGKPVDSVRKTLADKGREILTEQNKKVERVAVDGVTPATGLWLVNPARKRCAGLISRVKRTGEILWHDFYGMNAYSKQKDLINDGYKYIADMPSGEDWAYLHLGEWNNDSTMRQPLEEPNEY
jgi:hypothetical protein